MIRILTDSASDITPAEAEAMDVALVSLNIHFADQAYDQAADIDYSRFYDLLEHGKAFPTTSQPSPDAFAKVFAQAKEAGDSVVAILISGGLSGTLQAAQIAKDTVGYEDVVLIDSRTAIMPERILVEYAVKLRDAGESVASMVAKVEALIPRVVVFGMLDTLTYLYKGGRLSRTAALAGNLLRIRPIVTAKDGVIALAGRGRNDQALIKKLDELGYDPAFPVYFGYTANDANCRRLMQHTMERYTFTDTGVYPIGGVIGAHVGPNGMAIAFVTK